MTRRTQLFNFLEGLYVPVSLRDEFAQLLAIVRENDYRAIEARDSNKSFNDCLIIETKGRGKWETYSEFYICRVDVGQVKKSMVDVAVLPNGSSRFAPKRVNCANIKINIPND